MYQVKEVFYSLQGEGAQTGRASIFCRFAGCNLWSGREKDRESAVCRFCDTDFVGTDGAGGGRFGSAQALVDHLAAFWPAGQPHRHVICTGGEPLLQVDTALIGALHAAGFSISVETNGTVRPPPGIDWLCVSPKGTATVVVEQCDELKLVYPQEDAPPERYADLPATHYFLSPKNPPDARTIATDSSATRAAIEYCQRHPQWRLTLQTHKLLGIE